MFGLHIQQAVFMLMKRTEEMYFSGEKFQQKQGTLLPLTARTGSPGCMKFGLLFFLQKQFAKCIAVFSFVYNGILYLVFFTACHFLINYDRYIDHPVHEVGWAQCNLLLKRK